MHIALAAARLAAQCGGFAISRGRTATRETAIARMRATAVRLITFDAHQLHGGMGYVIETDLHCGPSAPGLVRPGWRCRRRREMAGRTRWTGAAADDRQPRRRGVGSRVGTVVAVATGEVYRRDWQRMGRGGRRSQPVMV